jgi:anaphase-promoting complex subunit 8
VNKELVGIEKELMEYYHKNQLNELNLYLYGMVLKERNNQEDAKNVFIECLNKYPLFWSVWLELSSLLTRDDILLFQKIRNHWMKNFFLASFYLEIHQESDSINLSTNLLKYFNTSFHLYNQIAHASYTSQGQYYYY